MKKIFLMALLCLSTVAATAQHCEVKSGSNSQLQLHLSASGPAVSETVIVSDTFSVLTMEGYHPSRIVGNPNLPVLTQIVEIPLCGEITWEMTNVVCDTVDGTILGIRRPVAPVQPSRRKSDVSPVTLTRNAKLYATDAFYGNKTIAVGKLGVARDRNLATVSFSPVSYNPVTNQVVIVKDADIVLHFENADLQGTREMKERYASGAFNSGAQTINTLPLSKDITTACTAPIHYLIVAHSSFRDKLDDFIAWKQRKGFIVTVGYTDDANVGTSTTSIATYIKSFYTNATPSLPAPTFLLLVGDVAQIPAFEGECTYTGDAPSWWDDPHVTDLYYATWTAGDLVPDCHYGRFSAQNLSQLTPQIEKTLMYEQYTFADPSFLDKAILVAGVDQGTSNDNAYRYGDPAMDYVAKTYINADNGYTDVKYYKNNTSFAPAGVTVTGSSQISSASSTLRSLYNQGAGWINYTAHGSATSWGDPSFTVSQVNSMTNTQKFGFMIGSCCLSSKFDESTCFGESLLRKDNYCGAVDYIGGSNSTYWVEDFDWCVGVRNNISNTMNASYNASHLGMYDRLFHTHNEAYGEWYTTASAMVMAGNMAVVASGSTGINYYWEIYHVLGDPSVMPWLGQAPLMEVSAPSAVTSNTESLNVTTAPHAYVALTDGHGTLISAAFANDGGTAVLPLSNPYPGTYELAVTAQNRQPHFSTVSVVPPDGPYLIANTCEVAGNGTIYAGGYVSFDVVLQNIGNLPTDANASYRILTDNSHIVLDNGDAVPIGHAVESSQTAHFDHVFGGTVRANIPDHTPTSVSVVSEWTYDEDRSSVSNYTFFIESPVVKMTGNNLNGNVEAGTEGSIDITCHNSGHAAMRNATATLVCPDPAIRVNSEAVGINSLDVDADTAFSFALVFDSVLPQSAVIPLYLTVSNSTHRFVDTIEIVIGMHPNEDFETGDFTAYNWTHSTYPWEITESNVHAGRYSARSKQNLGHSTSSVLTITHTNNSADNISFYYNVSSEANYDFFYFRIDGEQKLQVSGTDNNWTRATFPVAPGTHTYQFYYTKDGSQSRGSDCAWIDDITLPLSCKNRVYSLDTACQGETVTFHGITANTDNLTDGTYYFQDSTTSATTVYTLCLTVIGAPEVILSADHNPVLPRQNVTLTATGADTYEWSTGDTGRQIVVNPVTTTTYTVVGHKCNNSDTASITILVVAGTETPTEGHTLQAYPNPTDGQLRLTAVMEQVEVIDIVGRRVLSARNTDLIDLGNLDRGIYMLRATSNGTTSTLKVIKN